jgi:ABC-2 type transport system ATP-binding protein
LVRVRDISSADLRERLSQVSGARKAMVVKDDPTVALVRVYPKGAGVNGELARHVAELAIAEKWHVEEIHTEEGRLDEVFRSITLPETVKVQEESK